MKTRDRTDPGLPLPLAHSVEDACRLLSISRRHLYELIAEGKVNTIKLGARRLISHCELERLVSEGAE